MCVLLCEDKEKKKTKKEEMRKTVKGTNDSLVSEYITRYCGFVDGKR